MSITDVIALMRLLAFKDEIYPLSFPASAPDRAMIVELGDGSLPEGVSSDFIITITVRDIHPEKAERYANTVRQRLHGVTNVTINDNYIVQITSQSVVPSFLGKDEENRYHYSINLRAIV